MSTNQSLDKKFIERDGLFSTCALVQGKVFSFTSFKRIPMVGDLHTGKITLMEDLVNYDPVFDADNMLSTGDDIFILELNGKRLMKFNVKERICSYFNIGCDSKKWGNYAAFAYYKGNIYVFPIYEDGLIKIDLESGKVQKKKNLYTDINEYKKDNRQRNEPTFFWYGCQFENKVWLFQRCGNLAVAYDMESDTWRRYELSIKIEECEHVTIYAGKLYILSVEGEIYRWNMTNDAVEKVVDCRNISKSDSFFSRIAVTDKGIFLLPSISEEIFYIDLNTKNIIKYDSYPKEFQYCAPKAWCKYYGYCEDDDQYYFAMRSANYILSINKRDGREKWIKTDAPSYEEYKKIYFNYNRKMLCETECRVEDILSYMKKEDVRSQDKKIVFEGERIWDYVKILNKKSKEV